MSYLIFVICINYQYMDENKCMLLTRSSLESDNDNDNDNDNDSSIVYFDATYTLNITRIMDQYIYMYVMVIIANNE